MARDPNFYARRNQRAQLEGWRSYAHYRKAAEIRDQSLASRDSRIRDRFMVVAKTFGAPVLGVRQMRLWIRGVNALQADPPDHDLADEIGAQLPNGLRLEPERPESVFWYH